jgi:hypothetical protein
LTPVPGAIEFILKALDKYTVAIHSSRSHQWGGKRAMKRWLKRHLIEWFESDICAKQGVEALTKMQMADFNPGMEPWDVEVNDWAAGVINRISWPWFKPPAIMTIDDRAMTFTGSWPALEEIAAFRPWNKQVV